MTTQQATRDAEFGAEKKPAGEANWRAKPATRARPTRGNDWRDEWPVLRWGGLRGSGLLGVLHPGVGELFVVRLFSHELSLDELDNQPADGSRHMALNLGPDRGPEVTKPGFHARGRPAQ